MFLFGEKKIVGIDIGSSAIKIVEIKKKKREFFLENYAILFSGKEFSKEPLFSLNEKKLAFLLRKALNKAKIIEKKVSFSLPPASSFFTFISLPYFNPKELPQVIQLQASKYIPFSSKEAIIEWEIIKKTESEIKILLSATPQKIIEKYEKIAEFSGLILFSLENEACVEAELLGKKEYPLLIIDLGGKVTNFIISSQGKVKSTFFIEIGVEDFVRALSEKMNLSWQRSQKMLFKNGIFHPHVKNASQAILEKISFSLERELENFKNSLGETIKEIIFTGGGAQVPGILNYFEKRFEKKVSIANPFSKMNCPENFEEKIAQSKIYFSGAVGTALSSLAKM